MRKLNPLEELMLAANKKGQLKKATARDCAIIAEAHAIAFAQWVSFQGLEMYYDKETANKAYQEWLNRIGDE